MTAADMAACAERGMSAPPEVVYNTATDPTRDNGWLPTPLRRENRPKMVPSTLCVYWSPDPQGWSAQLSVRQGAVGGALVRLELTADLPEDRLAEIAEESLVKLARHVSDNLTAG
ncbi:MAG TPA: hypothetical protein VFX61_02630 [Micromonosporaceae bacterium]|nr:hypothetical protein [Micromonosporaceae bacterium]